MSNLAEWQFLIFHCHFSGLEELLPALPVAKILQIMIVDV